MSGAYIDHRWYGPPAAMAAALAGLTNVIGPRELDGVAYATVRSDVALPLPPGLGEIGPNLSTALMGIWMGQLPDVPASVTNFQAKTALRYAGMYDAAGAALEAMAAGLPAMDGAILRDAWATASFVRASPLVAGVAAALGLNATQMDDLFRAAGQVQV